MFPNTTMIPIGAFALAATLSCGGVEDEPARAVQATLRPQLMAAFAQACPSFAERWSRHVRSTPAEDRTGYDDVAVLAHHVVSLQRRASTAELSAAFSVAEQALKTSDETTRNLVSIGFFGDIQNIASHSPEAGSAADFFGYLGPVSVGEWRAIEEKWTAAGAAAERSGHAPALTVEQYQQTESDEVRRLIEVTTRRLPSGRIVTMGDVIRWEASGEQQPAAATGALSSDR